MIALGGSACPPAADPRWAEWSRPVAAFLRFPRAQESVLGFCRAHGVGETKAWNLLSWLTGEGLVGGAAGMLRLTVAGAKWLGDYALEDDDVRIEAPPRRGAPSRPEDLTGREFDRLTARELVDVVPGGARWRCDCKCGESVVVRACHLKSRRIKSCGCWLAELRASGRHPRMWRAA